ncbi:hypothetical protein Scep_024154 [Stephania cephalantha]|uniref:Uncharacterized protein n=1 Tax=Stephania cephalantha TaxID=152367 RepID=A0AAP0HY48_9MAGN
MPCPSQGAALLVLRRGLARAQRICLAHDKDRNCARAKERAKVLPCSCQGTTVLPAKECAKERAKVQPWSSQGTCQGATVLLPMNVPKNVPRSNRARAKVPLCSRQGMCQGTCQGPTVLVPRRHCALRVGAVLRRAPGATLPTPIYAASSLPHTIFHYIRASLRALYYEPSKVHYPATNSHKTFRVHRNPDIARFFHCLASLLGSRY